MQDSPAAHEIHCARCAKPLSTALIFRDGLYWHEACWQEGARLLANAERIARSLIPPLFLHETVMPESSSVPSEA
jgi:hypothetical protein